MSKTAKIAKGGKVSIPSACRKHLHLKDGDKVVFTLKDEEIVISPLKLTLEKVRAKINKHYPKESLVDKLIAERRIEAQNE